MRPRRPASTGVPVWASPPPVIGPNSELQPAITGWKTTCEQIPGTSGPAGELAGRLAPASAPEPLEAAPVRLRAVESRVSSIWITGAAPGGLAAPGEAAGLSGVAAPPLTVIGPPVDPAAPAGPPVATIAPMGTDGSDPVEVPLRTAAAAPTVADTSCASTCAAGGSKPGSVSAVIKMASSKRYEPRRVARRVAAAKNAHLRLIFLTAETHERTCVFSANSGNQPVRRPNPSTIEGQRADRSRRRGLPRAASRAPIELTPSRVPHT